MEDALMVIIRNQKGNVSIAELNQSLMALAEFAQIMILKSILAFVKKEAPIKGI